MLGGSLRDRIQGALDEPALTFSQDQAMRFISPSFLVLLRLFAGAALAGSAFGGLARGQAPPADPASTHPSAQPSWQIDRINSIVKSAANRAVQLTIDNATLATHYGRFDAAPGRAFLILATQWTNHITLTRINGKSAPTA